MSDPTSEDKVLREQSQSVAKGDDPSRVKRKLFMQLGFGTGRTSATPAMSAGGAGRSAAATTARDGGVLVPAAKLAIAALVGAAIATSAIVLHVSIRKTGLPAASTPGKTTLPTFPSTAIEVPFPSLTSETEPASPAAGPIAAPGPAALRSGALARSREAPLSERGVHDRAPSAPLVPASTSVGEHRSRRWRHKSKKHPPRALRRWRRKRSSCAKRMQRAKPAAPPALSLCSRSTAPALRTASWCRNAKRNA